MAGVTAAFRRREEIEAMVAVIKSPGADPNTRALMLESIIALRGSGEGMTEKMPNFTKGTGLDKLIGIFEKEYGIERKQMESLLSAANGGKSIDELRQLVKNGKSINTIVGLGWRSEFQKKHYPKKVASNLQVLPTTMLPTLLRNTLGADAVLKGNLPPVETNGVIGGFYNLYQHLDLTEAEKVANAIQNYVANDSMMRSINPGMSTMMPDSRHSYMYAATAQNLINQQNYNRQMHWQNFSQKNMHVGWGAAFPQLAAAHPDLMLHQNMAFAGITSSVVASAGAAYLSSRIAQSVLLNRMIGVMAQTGARAGNAGFRYGNIAGKATLDYLKSPVNIHGTISGLTNMQSNALFSDNPNLLNNSTSFFSGYAMGAIGTKIGLRKRLGTGNKFLYGSFVGGFSDATAQAFESQFDPGYSGFKGHRLAFNTFGTSAGTCLTGRFDNFANKYAATRPLGSLVKPSLNYSNWAINKSYIMIPGLYDYGISRRLK